MSLPSLSVKRPVTVFMVFLGVALLGLISWNRLPQELFPPITYPQLTVVTFYKDAAPEEIELLVTKPLEEVIGTVSGLRRISSTSKEEVSLIIAEFDWGKNMDFAALGVREKIDLVKERLPRGCEDPLVMKFNPFELPVMVLNVTAEGYSPGGLLQFTKKVIKNELEKTDGVAAVNISGGEEREILVEVDQGRLQATGVSIIAIADALKKANLNYPAGTFEEDFYEYLIRTMGEFKGVAEVKDIPIAIDENPKATPPVQGQENTEPFEKDKEEKDKRLILIKDVAEVKDTFKERTSISRYDKKDNISLSIIKQAGTNTLKVADNVKETLKEIVLSLPPNVKIEVSYDQSKFIESSLSGVRDSAVGGGILAFFVLLFFLKKISTSLIITISIPVSILAVFSLMYFSGITLNMISLGGLALGVGMLVDNSIVVLENIFRHRQEGKSSEEASIFGTEEVYSAITGSTLTTVAVFLPMAFVVGIAGQIFKELAFTVVFSLLASLVVALTIVPVLASKIKMNVTTDKIASGKKNEKKFSLNNVSKAYEGGLNLFLNNRFLSLFCIGIICLLVIKLSVNLDKELLPRVDQGQFIIKVGLPPGTRLAVTDRVINRIEDTLFEFSEIKNVTVSIGSRKERETTEVNIETLGSHQGQIMVELKPLADYKRSNFLWVQKIMQLFSKPAGKDRSRTISTTDLLQQFKTALEKKDLENAQIEYILQESVFQMAFQAGAPVVIEVKGEDLAIMKNISEKIEDKLKSVEGLYGVRSSLVAPAPEAKVSVRKDRAAQYNLSVSDIALTAQTAMKGYIATKYKEGGREIDVRVRLRKEDRKNVNKVRRLVVHSPLDIEVPLAEVAYLGIGKGPSQIQRLDQQRVILVSANILKRGFGEVANDVTSILSGMQKELPPDYTAKLTGENLSMGESFKSLQFALILSLVLVFMIMAAEFESLWQPLVILITFPLSIIGAVIALWFTRTPLSIMVALGVIILGGIVVNNGIVLIEYVNMLRRRDNYDALSAAIDASKTRLRPILMTALTTIFGLLPLALGLSEGAEIQVPMAITVMSGLFVSTFLSLVIVPAMYLEFEKLFNLFKKKPAQETLGPKEVVQEKITREDIALKPPPAEVSVQQKVIMPPSPKVEPRIPWPEPEKPPTIKLEPKPIVPPKAVQKVEIEELTDRQKKALEYLLINKKITRLQYAKFFDVSIPTAARDLKVLVDKKLIQGIGPLGKGRIYQLVQQ